METGGAPSQGMADRHPLTVRGDNDAATTREEAPEGGRSEPPYIPQFSAATSLILDRIKAKSGFNSALSDASASLTTPDRDAFEDARSRLVQSMRSSGSSDGNKPTIHPTADKTATAETEPTTRENGATAAGSKRKREDEPETESAEPEQHPRPEPEPVDFMQNTIVMPPPLPRRHPQKKKPATPVHDPRRQQQIEEARERRLAQYLPAEPAKPELVGFASGVASDEARTQYFYGLKKTDALNVLSFCDQIQPQLLVDILVSVSRRHPDLPMFDSPDWQATAMAALPPEKQQRRWRPALSSSKPRHGHSLLNSKARHNKGRVTARRPRTVAANTAPKKSPLKRSRLAQEVDNDQENVQGNGVEEEDVEVENPPPPMWPQPGEGLYAKLALETDDRSLLADDNDEEAFSHFLVNKMGRQVDPV